MKAYPTSTVDDPRPHQQTQVADERSIRKVKPRHKSSADQLHFSVGRGPSEILWKIESWNSWRHGSVA